MYAEVLALIEAREQTDEQFAALVAARADAQVASALSEDRYKLKKGTFIGAGTIVELLGRSGANLLRAMRNAAPQDPLIDEGVRLIDAGRWDIGSQATHNALDEIVAAGAMPAYVATALKNLGRTLDLIPTAVVTDVLDRRARRAASGRWHRRQRSCPRSASVRQRVSRHLPRACHVAGCDRARGGRFAVRPSLPGADLKWRSPLKLG